MDGDLELTAESESEVLRAFLEAVSLVPSHVTMDLLSREVGLVVYLIAATIRNRFFSSITLLSDFCL